MNVILEFFIMLWLLFKAMFLGIVYSFGFAPQKSLQGEVVLVTGAGSGLGRLLCSEMAKLGAIIVAWDVNTRGNEETVKMIKERHGTAYAYTCDVTKREEVYELAQKVRKDIGDVDILVNNAGIVIGKHFLDVKDEELEMLFKVNVMSHFWTIKSFLPSMKRRNHGHIVTIASAAGLVGCNKLSDYCATKFANVGFTETLDYELDAEGLDGVHTTTVCPYFIGTGMFEGCRTKFPAILPVLDPKETAKTTLKAIRSNQHIVVMPKFLYLTSLLKSILPVKASIALQKFFGSTTFMETFQGRATTKKQR